MGYWIRVKCAADVQIGDVLTHDITTDNTWVKANSVATPLGVAKTSAELKEETTDYFCDMVMGGQALARASRDIPNAGGELSVENGGVYVDNTTDHCGIIPPNNIESTPRVANQLIGVFIG